MVIATKKTIRKAEKKADFLFQIRKSEIVDDIDFGSFELIKTRKGIMFRNYTGYFVWTTPYAVGTDGHAHETSLYGWLNELIELYKVYNGHLDEVVVEGEDKPYTKGDIIDMYKITTAANLLKPMSIFLDRDEAMKEANKSLEWMNQMMNKLKTASESDVPEETEEDIKANAEFNAQYMAMENVSEDLKESSDEKGSDTKD